MDSRGKIVSGNAVQPRLAAWTGDDIQVVSGYFDPLLSQHAERLETLKRRGAKLVVVLTDPAEPILPASARAELVAALRMVDLVITGVDHGLSIEQRFDGEDAGTATSFVAHVLDRMN